MGIVNAVLVEWGNDTRGGFRWVEDSASIAKWGRREAGLSLSGVTNLSMVDRIARRWMAPKLDERTSYEGVISPDEEIEPGVGETLTVYGEEGARVVSKTWELIDDLNLAVSPEINSLAEQDEVDAIRTVERMIQTHGGSAAASAPIMVTGSRLSSGKFESVSLTPWSWFGEFNLEDLTDWEPQPLREPSRLTLIEINATPQPGGSDTVFVLQKNGAAMTPAISVTIAGPNDRGRTLLYRSDTLFPSDVLTPVLIADGGHTNGSVTVHAVRAT